MINAMLISLGVLVNWQGEGIIYVHHIQNRILYNKIDKMFYKLWKGYAFDVTYLKVWGCLAKVLFPKSKK